MLCFEIFERPRWRKRITNFVRNFLRVFLRQQNQKTSFGVKFCCVLHFKPPCFLRIIEIKQPCTAPSCDILNSMSRVGSVRMLMMSSTKPMVRVMVIPVLVFNKNKHHFSRHQCHCKWFLYSPTPVLLSISFDTKCTSSRYFYVIHVCRSRILFELLELSCFKPYTQSSTIFTCSVTPVINHCWLSTKRYEKITCDGTCQWGKCPMKKPQFVTLKESKRATGTRNVDRKIAVGRW